MVMLLFGVFGLVNFQGESGGSPSLYLFAAACASIGLLLVPSAVYSFNKVAGREVNVRLPDRWRLRPTILIFVLPAVLLLGHLVAQYDFSSLLFLPFFHIIAVGLPILWFMYLGIRGLPLGSKQRKWGVFASGLVLGPLLIMLAEIFLLGAVVLAGVALMFNQPEIINELITNIEAVANAGADPDQIVAELGPYILNPKILFLVFLFAALIVPLVEEALKPIGVWLLIDRDITPAEGFAAGLLSGAGYAFFESVALTSAAEEWMLVVVARIGTAVIHILTTGLMGWAMAYSWRHSNYIRVGLTYLGAVCLHGLWNGLALLMMLAFMVEEFRPDPDISLRMAGISAIAPFLLGLLSFVAFLALLWVNGYLNNTNKGEGQPEAVL